jgi:regulator of sigma D
MFSPSASPVQNAYVRQMITELKAERSQVWGLYCQIADMKSVFASSEIRPVLSNFLQLLIDYVSLGHFGMYEQLTKSGLPDDLSYAGRIYPEFSRTTASAVFFSERYESGRANFRTDKLAQDLSILGENLAQRMELEDRLCFMLLH